MTLNKLLARHAQANKKWLKACKSPHYPYDEAKPLKAKEKQALRWAIIWRRAVHEIEDKMLADPEVIKGLVEGLTSGSSAGVAYFEAEIRTNR